MHFRRQPIAESTIYEVLSNRRRYETLRVLNGESDAVPVSELAAAIAREECEQGSPPKSTRDSVYSSLHQTHLPKLDELGVIRYDRDQRIVEPLAPAREFNRYMELVTRFGFTWGEYYRALGVTGLLVSLGSLLEVPLVSLVDPILWCSLGLFAYAASSAYQLWTHPMSISLRDLLGL